MRNGISLPLWAEPRYLTMRNRRVELWSSTRWSSTITQSETYSSSPWRVRCSASRSPVTMAVTPFSFSHRNSRRQLGAHHEPVGEPGEQQLDGVEHHAFRANGIDGVPQPDEQSLEIIFARLQQLGALEVDVIEQQPPPGAQPLEVEAERPAIGHQIVGRLLE